LRRVTPQAWSAYMDEMEKQRACGVKELCPQCDVPLFPSSGQKLQCRKCGYLVVCCEGPA
jgi:ribosomal protein S27AE